MLPGICVKSLGEMPIREKPYLTRKNIKGINEFRFLIGG
jgi:hypothetical protein